MKASEEIAYDDEDSEEFYAALQNQVLGRYSPGGESEVMLPGMSQAAILESTVVHENTHKYLFQSTSFGFAQQVFYALANATTKMPAELVTNSRNLIKQSTKESLLLHEGAATFRQHCWIQTEVSPKAAATFLNNKPEVYRTGYELISAAVDQTGISEITPAGLALLLAEGALSTTILDILPDILDGDLHGLEQSINSESPNSRMRRISERLSADESPPLEIPEQLLAEMSGGLIPERSRNYAMAWAALLRGLAKKCDINIYGIESYPEQFFQRLRETTEELEKRAKTKSLGLEFSVNLPPDGHDEAWSWALEAEANVKFVPNAFPQLEWADDYIDPSTVQQWCVQQLKELGPNAVIYAHLFLPRRLLKLPINPEFEDDADHVLVLRPYAPDFSATSPDEKVLRVSTQNVATTLLHPDLKGRIAFSSALVELFPESSAEGEMVLPDLQRKNGISELAQSEPIFLYPSLGTIHHLKNIVLMLTENYQLQWEVVLSEHWKTAVIILSTESSNWFIAAHSSERGVLEFGKWADAQGDSVRNSKKSRLMQQVPQHLFGTFLSHFIRFGY